MHSKTIISTFKRRYGHLKKYGLKINSEANLIVDFNVISISTPFMFDKRQIPNKFMGLTVRSGTCDLPYEFQNIDNDREYLWAYQRFESFVDKHGELIKQKLEDLQMTRQEMLDALCFGDFETHKAYCIKGELEGRIPKWTK